MVERLFQRGAKPLLHFRCGRFGEGDHQNFLERRALPAKAIQATRDERVSFARARTGHDQHVAARSDRLPLRGCQRIALGVRGFHPG
jgi:hypothetical protein